MLSLYILAPASVFSDVKWEAGVERSLHLLALSVSLLLQPDCPTLAGPEVGLSGQCSD